MGKPKIDMVSLEYIKVTRDYLDYLEEHIKNVQRAFWEINEKCKDMNFIWEDCMYWSLHDSVMNHDVSKFSVEEFVQYRKNFYPAKAEEKNKKEFQLAWEHHYKHNDHHWENWTKATDLKYKQAIVCCAHMVIDWMAMSYRFGGTAQEYYEKNKEIIILPDWAVKFIYDIFNRVYTFNKNVA